MMPAEPLIPFAAFPQPDARSSTGAAAGRQAEEGAAPRGARPAAVAVEPVVDRMRERALEMGIDMGIDMGPAAGAPAAPRAARGSSPNLRR